MRGTSREKLFLELGLTSLYDRRRLHRLTLLYKILNALTPQYLRRFIPNSISRLQSTRTNREETMPTRTLKFRYTFFPDTLNSWSHLGSFIKSSISLSVFKKRLMEFFNVTPNPIYGIHNPVGLKFLTRLRVGFTFAHISTSIILAILLQNIVPVETTYPKLLNIIYYIALSIRY